MEAKIAKEDEAEEDNIRTTRRIETELTGE